MNPTRRTLASMMTACLIVLGAGCGEGSKPEVATDLTTEATVKGKVMLKGQPAKGGEITFDPSNYRRKMAEARTAKIGEDGSYEVKTLVGENSIRLGGDAVKQMPIAQFQTFSYDVKAGENKFDIDLKDAAAKDAAAKDAAAKDAAAKDAAKK